jgi:hypothetical protein
MRCWDHPSCLSSKALKRLPSRQSVASFESELSMRRSYHQCLATSAEISHHRLTIDPAADNAGAIRAYEKVGFRRVGIMRKYERGPDGIWRDGLLMDLLEEEFRP